MDSLDGAANREARSVKEVYAELKESVELPKDRQKTAKGVLQMGRLVLDLKQAITDSGLTHYAIGKAADVDIGSIDRFMSGERDLRLVTASKIAEALGYELMKTVTPIKKAATTKIPRK